MALNTLTDIMPVLYKAFHKVSRKITGSLMGVYRNSEASQAALNETIKYPIVPGFGASNDITPAATAPDPDGRTIGKGEIVITKAKAQPFFFTGEDERALDNGGMLSDVTEQTFTQAIMSLCNEMALDVNTTAYQNASRVIGVPGVTPFKSNLDELALVRQILIDNGCTDGDLHLTIDTSAGVNLRNLAQLQKQNETPDQAILKQGILTNLGGFDIHEDAFVVKHTKGTGNGYQLNGAGAAKATTLGLDTGTGTILAGDILNITDEANRYCVNTALDGGNITIAEPGLINAIANDTTVTIGNSYRANFAHQRYALHLVTRLPSMPKMGDMAADVTVLTDPITKLSFAVALYKQYKRVMIEISIVWAVKAIKKDWITILQG